MRKSSLLLIFCMLLILPSVIAKQGEISVLTVATEREGSPGGTAKILLDVRPGSGRIFIDSLPLSRLDTQISMRFGQELACSYVDADCSVYDFFYTIRADSNLVGGPSAGAAVSVLTISILDDLPLRKDVVLTGTINAGGLIGPVAGIEQKALAAQKAGFSKILVPEFEIPHGNNTNTSNKPLNISGIDVVRVSNLDEALYHFTGRQMGNGGTIIVPDEYMLRMKGLASYLCARSREINASIKGNLSNQSQEKYSAGISSMGIQDYYSAASFCFSANLILRRRQLESSDDEMLKSIRADVIEAISLLNLRINSIDMQTLSDLQTYMIVAQRLKDASDALQGNISSDNVAYGLERYQSALSWSELFGMSGKALRLDESYLRDACLQKISEAEERFNFIDLYAPGSSASLRGSVDDAYLDARNGNYEVCLFRASKAKAEANLVVSGITIPASVMPDYLDEKLDAASSVIVRQQEKGIFPILGYSYYEYARSLEEDDLFSALTFAEYSVELSNIDIYFPPESDGLGFDVNRFEYLNLVFGFLLGFGFCLFLVSIVLRKK